MGAGCIYPQIEGASLSEKPKTFRNSVPLKDLEKNTKEHEGRIQEILENIDLLTKHALHTDSPKCDFLVNTKEGRIQEKIDLPSTFYAPTNRSAIFWRNESRSNID